MIDDLQKTDDSSLADNEIASLMKTLASDKYRETIGFPKKSIQPFKSVPLNKIALQANEDKNLDGALNDDMSEQSTQELPVENNNESNDDSKPSKFELEEATSAQKIDEENLPSSSTVPGDSGIVSPSEPPVPVVENSNQPSGLLKQNDSRPIGVPIKDKLYTEEEKEAAYQKGMADAQDRLKAEQETKQDSTFKVLEGLIKNLEQQIIIDTGSLESFLKDEILSIATERAGAAIKEIPKEFLQKIETLAQIIKNKGQNPILRLNPQDYQAITPLLKNSLELTSFKVHPDDSLQHSDIIIELDGVSIEDRIYDRYSSNEKGGTRNFKIASDKESLENSAPQNKKDETDNNLETSLSPPLDDLKGDELTNTTNNEFITEESSNAITGLEPVNLKTLDDADDAESPKTSSFSKKELPEKHTSPSEGIAKTADNQKDEQ